MIQRRKPKPVDGIRITESRWRPRPRARKRHVVVPGGLMSDLRREIYYRQNGVRRLTPAQRRRIRHKENAGRG